MKKIILPIVVLSQIIVADEIDNIINKIKEDRKSKVTKTELINIKSPLIKIVDKKKNEDNNKSKLTVNMFEDEANFNLTAIMNKRAYINKKWVKIGDSIDSYKVVDIMDDSVFLKEGNRTKLVTFKSKITKIKLIGR